MRRTGRISSWPTGCTARPEENAEGEEKSAADIQLDLTQQPKQQIQQVLELIGAKVALPQQSGQQDSGGQQGSGESQQQIVSSPFASDAISMATYLPTLMDACTAVDATVIPGRINVNQAPAEVLLGIPGMTQEIVDQIISLRSADSQSTSSTAATSTTSPTTSGTTIDPRSQETWLLSEGVVTLDEMKQFMPFLCGGGDVFRTQIVGYYQGGGPSARCEVVFDATGSTPRVLFWRDISHLGRGYALETLGVDLLQ